LDAWIRVVRLAHFLAPLLHQIVTRSHHQDSAIGLSKALDDDEAAIAVPIRIEILSGAARADMARLRRTLSALPTFYPSEATWQRIEGWLETIKKAGDSFGAGDMLIASIGAEHHSAIWSLDGVFGRMAKLKLVDLYKP
jgi:predicted nucleic acid-binding protein